MVAGAQQSGLSLAEDAEVVFEPNNVMNLENFYAIPWLTAMSTVTLQSFSWFAVPELKFVSTDVLPPYDLEAGIVRKWNCLLNLKLNGSVQVQWEEFNITVAYGDARNPEVVTIVPETVDPNTPVPVVLDLEQAPVCWALVIEPGKHQVGILLGTDRSDFDFEKILGWQYLRKS